MGQQVNFGQNDRIRPLEGGGVLGRFVLAFRQAEQGNAQGLAQVELGRLYEKGTGVKADDNAALIWYEVAGMNGRDTADEVAAISARLSPEEVRQAQADPKST